PGAPADHLTSVGGTLLDNTAQMSALEWLTAGATGSYGTVIEPCNHLQKFPHPGILMSLYAEGDTLIEAYWKSVAWPGEGVFIGEPLARPFGTRAVRDEAGWWVESYSATGRRAVIEMARSVVGPYRAVQQLMLPAGFARQRLKVDRGVGAVRVR
ncbi:MAG: TIGR03790 family protein, partial [Methyloversatilis sp. 12-65-5]